MIEYLIVVAIGFGTIATEGQFDLQYAGRGAGPDVEHPFLSECHFSLKDRDVSYDEAKTQVKAWLRNGRPVYLIRRNNPSPPDGGHLYFDFSDVAPIEMLSGDALKERQRTDRIREIRGQIRDLERELKGLERK